MCSSSPNHDLKHPNPSSLFPETSREQAEASELTWPLKEEVPRAPSKKGFAKWCRKYPAIHQHRANAMTRRTSDSCRKPLVALPHSSRCLRVRVCDARLADGVRCGSVWVYFVFFCCCWSWWVRRYCPRDDHLSETVFALFFVVELTRCLGKVLSPLRKEASSNRPARETAATLTTWRCTVGAARSQRHHARPEIFTCQRCCRGGQAFCKTCLSPEGGLATPTE